MSRVPEARLYLDDDEIIVDSFAGGGGASKGIEMALGRGPDIAINHDAEAIALHKANHPESQHYNEDVWTVDPVKAVAGRRVGVMWLSPDCKHFSKAKGGKPVSPRVRGLAWVALRWANAVRPRIIVLENVEEFQTWGPLYKANHPNKKLRNRPIPEKRGLTFKIFVGRLRGLGYTVEYRELRACDFGAPTIRKRLFLIARCDGQPIVWPKPTHGKHQADPWHTAAECIDFSHDCPSIFTRKKPLAENTLKRIAAGLRRFVFEADKPFIIGVGGRMAQSAPRSMEQPYQTITAKADAAIVTPALVQYYGAKREGDDRTADVNDPLFTQTTENRFGLVEPYLVPLTHHGSDERVDSLRDPMKTVTGAHRGEVALVAPHITKFRGGAVGSSADSPMPTVTANGFIKRPGGSAPLGYVEAQLAPFITEHANSSNQRNMASDEPLRTQCAGVKGGHFSVVAPVMVPRYGEREGQSPRAQSVEKPLSTIVPTQNGASLVAAFMAQNNTGNDGHQMEFPLSTIVQKGCTQSLVTSSLVNMRGTGDSQLVGRSIEEPLPTISGGGIHAAEVRAFLVAYYGAEKDGGSLFDPMRTLSTRDRFGLVTVEGVEYQLADIGLRMLQPRELYRAQGFPDSYKIDIPFTSYYTKKGKLRKKPKTAPLSKTAQVRMCGNSVCPDVAAAIIAANVAKPSAGSVAA